MRKLEGLQPERVFYYFEEISNIPRGSGNMEGISKYCLHFAEEHGLKAIRDAANNVIIYKPGSAGYENAKPVILQGHLDMVCQKTPESTFDFEKDGISLMIKDDFITADGTTLGADNGIGVALALAILDDENGVHPPIEALFTADEEIGMIGAGQVDGSLFKGRKMINMDSGNPGHITVSCAGGSDFVMEVPVNPTSVSGTKVTLALKGLMGGHSGVMIRKGGANANILLGRILNFAATKTDFEVISVNGGDKANAICLASEAQLVVENADAFVETITPYLETVKQEICDREPNFAYDIAVGENGTFDVLNLEAKDKTVGLLTFAPNGVMSMSVTIANLVETSLNLGVLQTDADKVIIHFALRSNKQSGLEYLEEKLTAMAKAMGVCVKTFGHYPPWEFKEDSELQRLYKETYREKTGEEATIFAVHAGLECGILSKKIPGLDCIAISPVCGGGHTTQERLNIPSVGLLYELLQNLLKKLK